MIAAVLSATASATGAKQQPNLIVLLTDDQDLTLGSMQAIAQALQAGKGGINWYGIKG